MLLPAAITFGGVGDKGSENCVRVYQQSYFWFADSGLHHRADCLQPAVDSQELMRKTGGFLESLCCRRVSILLVLRHSQRVEGNLVAAQHLLPAR